MFYVGTTGTSFFVLLLFLGVLNTGVVYFDQGLGAAHAKRWSKYAKNMFFAAKSKKK